jgi:diguanylate cyclase (GGDEF)-like protein/PAS domain S-box-containing protein
VLTGLGYLLASPEPVLIVAEGGDERIVALNRAARSLFRLDTTARDLLPLQSLLPGIVAAFIAVEADESIDPSRFVRCSARTGDGHEAVMVGAVRGPPGKTPRIAIFVRTAERPQVDEAGEERSRLSALAMASTTDSVVIADARLPDYPIVYVNEAFERLTGYAAREVMGRNCRFLHGADCDQRGIEQVRTALSAGTPCRVTLRNYRKDGTQFWNQLTLSPVNDEGGSLTHFVGVQSDVTNSKQNEAELLRRATHDSLTGLPNHELLEERLESALRDADRSGTLVAVAFVDIDRLKRVNDSLGHAGGDTFIGAVASRLSNAVRSLDTVARYGGDEFVIVFRDLADTAAVEVLIARLRHLLGAPLIVENVELEPSASVGIALYPQDATSVAQLIRVADTAMYAAKATERGSFRFFDRTTMRTESDELAMENALRRALATGELKLHYQPIFNALTGRLAALEGLLRWRHPERGIIAPGDFIPLAEESGLIVPIGEWALREVCRQHRAWAARGVPLVPIAMNVSIVQLRRRDFCSTFKRIVREAGVDPRWIVLEITESIVMDNTELFVEMLSELRATGARISIDDFGTGFSSLGYLKRLSADSLKIDKSFVDDITSDRNAAAICQAIVTLAHSVGLIAVAEGVETPEQAAFLCGIGCDELQGFHFAHPGDAAAMEPFLILKRVPAA